MLCELHLRNLAVAEEVSFRLEPGLNVLSGSTGAGKSLVTEAVRWLRGESVDRSVLRTGATSASAEAVFDLHRRPRLAEQIRDLGVELAEDGILRVRRELRDGRTRAWVDGRLASAALLRDLAEVLVQSQEQHLQLGLRDPRRHVELLDALGTDPGLVDEWEQARAGYEAARREVSEWERRRDQLGEQRELLDYQWRELDAARLRGDELETLRAAVALQEGGARLLEIAQTARDFLDDEQRGADAALAAALAQLRKAPAEVPEAVEAAGALEGALDLVREASAGLERLLEKAEVDPSAFAAAQERLAELQDLTRKYSRTEAELVRLRDRLREQLDLLDSADEVPEALREALEAAGDRLAAAGKALHAARRKVARSVAGPAAALLGELGMEGARLDFEFVPEPDPDGVVKIEGRKVRALAHGPADVVLAARTNPGERATPVHRGASGGELSRIALVLRSLSVADRAPALLLLDEVDAGVGADLAPAVARRLSALADGSQLLVITHQASIAAAADHHLVAHKDLSEDRVCSSVHALDGDARVEELVRMLGADTPESRQLAGDLLAGRGAA